MSGRSIAAGAMVVAFAAVAGAQSNAASSAAGASGVAQQSDALVRYLVAPSGNEARYRVRELLVGVALPNDAVGTVHDITGGIVVDAEGRILRDSSRIVVRLTALKSDKSRRDGYVQRRTLETSRFPTVELVPTAFKGITAPPEGATPTTFELLGDLTIRGVTRPTTWTVTARAEGDDIVGHAATAFTFKDFSLNQPRVPVVLSVQDTIALEYDFRFTRADRTP